ncbi:MAG: hypothetical protein M3Y08_15150 [Fibrobacterota bacterium]|nr:hypothetical protein [Fibrobacterota bacterium]
MDSTDTRTVDPAQPHHSENGGHEMSDFSWTTVLWLLPLSVILLVTFFAVCILWFKGAASKELIEKQAEFTTSQLNELRVKEGETLNQYKWLDKDKGRVQIPISRAMELMAKENQNSKGRDWTPITDIYLEGAPFQTPSETEPDGAGAQDTGVSIGRAPSAHAPAQDVSKQESGHGAPSGGHASEKKH